VVLVAGLAVVFAVAALPPPCCFGVASSLLFPLLPLSTNDDPW